MAREEMKEFRRGHRWSLEIGRNLKSKNHGGYNTCRNGLELEAGKKATWGQISNVFFTSWGCQEHGKRNQT